MAAEESEQRLKRDVSKLGLNFLLLFGLMGPISSLKPLTHNS